MEYANCKVCGKVFLKVRDNICPDCREADERDFAKVREFLKEFPGSSASIVIEYTGVPEKKVMRYLREGRIEILDDSQNFLTCLKCGKPITTGKYCKDCYLKFSKEVKNLYTVKEPEVQDVVGKMRFLNKD